MCVFALVSWFTVVQKSGTKWAKAREKSWESLCRMMASSGKNHKCTDDFVFLSLKLMYYYSAGIVERSWMINIDLFVVWEPITSADANVTFLLMRCWKNSLTFLHFWEMWLFTYLLRVYSKDWYDSLSSLKTNLTSRLEKDVFSKFWEKHRLHQKSLSPCNM